MKQDPLLQKLAKPPRKGLLVDTNLLLLYFVGGLRRQLIKSFSRTANFSEEDFELLARIIHRFNRILTTPHILTEVSNLLGQYREPDRSALLAFLGSSVQGWRERHHPARHLARAECFPRLGLTDASIVHLAASSCLVLTNDWALARQLGSRGLDVLDFRALQGLCL